MFLLWLSPASIAAAPPPWMCEGRCQVGGRPGYSANVLMHDAADPDSRRHCFNRRVVLSGAIVALGVLLVPANVAAVGFPTTGETEATTQVETAEEIAGRRGEHNQRRRAASRRMVWPRRLRATRRNETGRLRRRREVGRLPLSPCHPQALTRAPPTPR